MDMHLSQRALRRFFLLWIGIAYLGQLASEISNSIDLCSFQKNDICTPHFDIAKVSVSSLLASTVLTILSGILLWLAVTGKIQRSMFWLFIALQTGAILLISLLVPQQDSLALSLYLAFTLGVVAIFSQIRPSLVVLLAIGYFTLLLLIIAITGFPKAKSYIWVFLLQTLPTYAMLFQFVIGYLLLYMRLAQAHKQLQTSTAQVTTLTRLTERQRMARELHDTLAQGLAGLILELQVADTYQTQQRYDRAQTIIQQAIKRANTAFTEARQAIDDLRLVTTNHNDFLQTLQEEICHFTTITGISCETDLHALTALPPLLREHALRTITEGLNNIALHAHAQHTWLRTTRYKSSVEIQIADDGIGFDAETIARQSGHYGLLGLRERAHLAGGSFEITSEPGKGSCLRLRLPETTEKV